MCVSTHSQCLTASSQFASLNTWPLSFIITRPSSHMSDLHNHLVSILILISGDNHSNPGTISNVSTLNMCILYIRSLTNPLHFTAIYYLAKSHSMSFLSLKQGFLWFYDFLHKVQQFWQKYHSLKVHSHISSSGTQK